MSIQYSAIIASQVRANGAEFSVRSIDVHALGEQTSPVVVLDHFRVRGQPFAPHPHAGFSAVTYVLRDSETGLRSRDSLGNDVVVGPGGVVWTQAGSGVIHEEVPAEPGRELHGVQIFVNTSAKHKFAAPQVLELSRRHVPTWSNDTGDRLSVVVGGFCGTVSPLVPIEPFTFLDVELRREISVELQPDHYTLVYTLTGDIGVRAERWSRRVPSEQALALRGDGGRVVLTATEAAHVLLVSGPEIRESVVAHGSFIMNELAQIDDAVARYRRGEMGQLAPLKQGRGPRS